MQKNRRIYSLNIISYLAMNNIEFKLLIDNDNKVYAVVENEISDLLEEYKSNDFLQKFLHSYQDIRKFIKENKNNN